MLELLLVVLNGRGLLLWIRLEAAWGGCVTARRTGVSGKNVTDEIVMIHETQKGAV